MPDKSFRMSSGELRVTRIQLGAITGHADGKREWKVFCRCSMSFWFNCEPYVAVPWSRLKVCASSLTCSGVSHTFRTSFRVYSALDKPYNACFFPAREFDNTTAVITDEGTPSPTVGCLFHYV